VFLFSLFILQTAFVICADDAEWNERASLGVEGRPHQCRSGVAGEGR